MAHGELSKLKVKQSIDFAKRLCASSIEATGQSNDSGLDNEPSIVGVGVGSIEHKSPLYTDVLGFPRSSMSPLEGHVGTHEALITGSITHSGGGGCSDSHGAAGSAGWVASIAVIISFALD